MRNKADKRLWTLSIVGCVIVVLTVLFVSIKVETNNVKNRIHSTIEYIRDQYSMYNSFNDAVEAKSLVRMVEKVQQTARNFKADDQALEKEHLKQYAGEQKLTGIIVLNDKDQQIAQYHMGSRFQKVMDYVMEKETLRDVKKYPQKSYMARIDLKNGGYIDLASYGRIDAKGTIIGYQYIKAEYAKNSELTIKNVLAGYKQENGKCVMLPQPGLLQKITGSDVRDFTFTSPAEPSVTANWDGQTIDMPIFNDIMEPVEEGETLAFYDNSYYAGKPAVIRKNTGKGYAIHFGSTFSRESMKVLLEYTGILEPFQAMLEAPQEVEVIQRVKGNKKYFFVLNYMGSEQKIVLKKQMRSLYDNVIANGEICMKPYETIVYEVLE